MDIEIAALISEEKDLITNPPKGFKIDLQCLRKELTLGGCNSDNRYSVFIRKHKIFQEDFSIGLVYHSPGGQNLILIRMNGKHKTGKGNTRISDTHFQYHIHFLKEEDLEREIFKPRHKEITREYVSFEQAFDYFCRKVNIKEYQKHFPSMGQLGLFNDN